jgi:hypothetical protein
MIHMALGMPVNGLNGDQRLLEDPLVFAML